MRKNFLTICLALALLPFAIASAASAAGGGAPQPGPQSVPTALKAAADTPPPDAAALFDLFATFSVESYRLEPGDTLSAIAKDRGLTVETLLSYNRIQSPRFLQAGQKIEIPSSDGILISVAEPTPVSDILNQYRIQPDWFLTVNASLVSGGKIEGDVFLPGVRRSQDELSDQLGIMLSWPTAGGRISSYYGKRKDPFTGAPSSHKGMDIAVRMGSPVFAAAGGTVMETGYDAVLGKYIRVNMGKGVTTLYGHLSSIMTKRGAKVVRGQQIGKVGSTGYSTGPHLHFVVHKNGKIINPLLIFG